MYGYFFFCFTCHLAGIAHSSGYAQFGQEIKLQKEITGDDDHKNGKFFHFYSFFLNAD